ncbi:hypothetical protein VKS41_000108 [Umbelopsis sp. WA50703]|jgi:hypothetical protein
MSNQQEQYYHGPRLTFNDDALAEQNEEMIYFDDENYCYEYNDSLYQEESDMMYYEEEMYREEYDQPEHEQPETCSTKQEGQDALLNLVVGVQQYLADLQMTGFDNRQESPLLDLQYKMYTYLKQRAYEMGADLDEALEQAM